MRYPLTISPIDTVSLRPRFVVRDADEQAVASLEHDAAVDVSGVLLGRTPCLKVLGGDDFESLLFDVRWHERDDAKTTFLDAKGRTIGSIDALTAKGSDPSCPVTCRRADGSGLFLLHDRRAHTHRLLRWLYLGTSRRHWSFAMSGWDVLSIGTYLLGKSDFASTHPDGTPIMSGEGRLQSMGGVTIWLHADLDEAEHDLALLAAFSQAFLIVS